MKYLIKTSLFIALIFFCTASLSAQKIKTATFNIRMATSADGENEWKYRVPLVEQALKAEHPDVIGFQEVLHTQLLDLQRILPDYNHYGVGREDFEEKGEYAAIFYRKDRFALIEGNTFVLAPDTLAVGALGWDAVCTRIVTWVMLEDIKTKTRFCFFNTHFDHIGKVAHQKSAELLVQKALQKAVNCPVIITGDFNATPTSEAYAIMTQSFTDSRTIARKVNAVPYTYQGFRKIPTDQYCLIDYIFVTGQFKVKRYRTLCPEQNGVLVSDHNIVIAELVL
ncbi:MAG TPA: endonuclease/exonuclease/phosphatase family protein [Bacteroidales bacterium]|nr:endonuclease/exonuclease/phosphatase family protein [Bacteroidales bacterium]HRZ49330.1 endonuclease/exonuclease/phosphatase family protein [Bacteroidales bacterium]